jgi:HAD superfamily phosphatase (TIGR01668 family)
MLLMPRFMLPNIHGLTDDFLAANGIRGIIFDIDNTLVGFTDPKPTQEVLALLERLSGQGIKIAIASNNSRERVGHFAEGLGIPAYHRACKPLPFALGKIRRQMGLKAKEIAVVGDQIYTDILGANCSGMISVLVDIIDTKETIFFKIKRALERPVIERKRRKDAKK